MAVAKTTDDVKEVKKTPVKKAKIETEVVTYPLGTAGRNQLFVAVDGVGEAILIAGEPCELPIPLAEVAKERIAQEQNFIKKTRRLEQDLVDAQSR